MVDEIDERVTRWILRLDRESPSDKERAEFEAWLAASSEHRVAYTRLNEAWKSTEGLKAWRPHDGSIDAMVLRQTSARSSSGQYWKWAAAGASVLACVLIAALATPKLKSTDAIYSTQVGGYQRVMLEDGSVIQLNTNSEARVELQKAHRVVHLMRGEAYFEIARDIHRPFDVIAGNSVVRAVGTGFSVRLKGPEQIEVAVTQGRVAISSGSVLTVKSQVSAGEIARAQPDRVVVAKTESAELQRRLAWEEGELAFKKEKLADVVTEFNRYNRKQLEVSDPKLAELEVGGNFKSTDLESFVSAVSRSMNIKAEESGGVIHLSTK